MAAVTSWSTPMRPRPYNGDTESWQEPDSLSTPGVKSNHSSLGFLPLNFYPRERHLHLMEEQVLLWVSVIED